MILTELVTLISDAVIMFHPVIVCQVREKVPESSKFFLWGTFGGPGLIARHQKNRPVKEKIRNSSLLISEFGFVDDDILTGAFHVL